MNALTLIWAGMFGVFILAAMLLLLRFTDSFGKFIACLNSLNTPWVAITVIIVGMAYSVIAHTHGISGDGPSGVIGAGIGLLTGQALSRSQQSSEPMPPAKLPTTPVEPA